MRTKTLHSLCRLAVWRFVFLRFYSTMFYIEGVIIFDNNDGFNTFYDNDYFVILDNANLTIIEVTNFGHITPPFIDAYILANL